MYYNSIYMLALCFLIVSVSSFTPTNLSVFTSQQQQQQQQQRQEHSTIVLFAEGGGDSNDSNQVVGKRIIVKGDVNGGYVRTCIQNEVRFIIIYIKVIEVHAVLSFLGNFI